MQKETFEAVCKDGVALKGVLLIPQNPKAVVQFNCGTACKKEFYLPFLTHLAENGYLCCLWDYRGSGDSAPRDMKNCDFTFSDYGLKDMPAIKNYLTTRFPYLPFFIVGHSAGGQQLGFMDNLKGVKGVVNFAVSAGYYPNMPLGYRLQAYFFFYLFTPLSVALKGYVAAKRFGFMEDLPRNVAIEWRKWCAKKDYFFDPKFYGKTVPIGNYQNFDFPIHTFWTPDDTISNQKNTENLWQHFKSTKGITFTRLEPRELGLKNIGHFGFFRKTMKEKLWNSVVEKLESMH